MSPFAPRKNVLSRSERGLLLAPFWRTPLPLTRPRAERWNHLFKTGFWGKIDSIITLKSFPTRRFQGAPRVLYVSLQYRVGTIKSSEARISNFFYPSQCGSICLIEPLYCAARQFAPLPSNFMKEF